MKIKKVYFISFLLLILLCSCSGRKAKSLLNEAETYYNQENFSLAEVKYSEAEKTDKSKLTAIDYCNWAGSIFAQAKDKPNPLVYITNNSSRIQYCFNCAEKLDKTYTDNYRKELIDAFQQGFQQGLEQNLNDGYADDESDNDYGDETPAYQDNENYNYDY